MKKLDELLDIYRLTDEQEKEFQTSVTWIYYKVCFGNKTGQDLLMQLHKSLILEELVFQSEIEAPTLCCLLKEHRTGYQLIEDNQYLQNLISAIQQLTLSELFDLNSKRQQQRMMLAIK